VVFIATVIVGAGMVAYVTKVGMPTSGTAGKMDNERIKKQINLLVYCLDSSNGDNTGTLKNSDTMIIASIHPEERKLSLLFIPKDTQVQIPGYKGSDGINHANAYGGQELAKNTVEQFLNIPIDYCMSIEWSGLIKVVDILGGIDLYVDRDMDYDDPKTHESIHLTKGYKHLDGIQAGEYLGFQHDELGDIGRTERQQRLLKALSGELFQFRTILKLPALMNVYRYNMSTDMTPWTMLVLADKIKNIKKDDVRIELIPGRFATKDGGSYWVPDKVQTQQLVNELFAFPEEAKVDGNVPAKNTRN
jgi:LCP family protein required for cell wall assembly